TSTFHNVLTIIQGKSKPVHIRQQGTQLKDTEIPELLCFHIRNRSDRFLLRISANKGKTGSASGNHQSEFWLLYPELPHPFSVHLRTPEFFKENMVRRPVNVIAGG